MIVDATFVSLSLNNGNGRIYFTANFLGSTMTIYMPTAENTLHVDFIADTYCFIYFFFVLVNSRFPPYYPPLIGVVQSNNMSHIVNDSSPDSNYPLYQDFISLHSPGNQAFEMTLDVRNQVVPYTLIGNMIIITSTIPRSINATTEGPISVRLNPTDNNFIDFTVDYGGPILSIYREILQGGQPVLTIIVHEPCFYSLFIDMKFTSYGGIHCGTVSVGTNKGINLQLGNDAPTDSGYCHYTGVINFAEWSGYPFQMIMSHGVSSELIGYSFSGYVYVYASSF